MYKPTILVKPEYAKLYEKLDYRHQKNLMEFVHLLHVNKDRADLHPIYNYCLRTYIDCLSVIYDYSVYDSLHLYDYLITL